MGRQLQPCGTRAAYVRHLRHDEEPCGPCNAANNADGIEDRRVFGRARGRAQRKLARHYPDRLAELLAKERALEEEPETGAAYYRARQRALTGLAKERDLADEYAALLDVELERVRGEA